MVVGGYDKDDRDSPIFKEKFRGPIHETLFDIAKENLDGTDVVIVAPFTRERKEAGFVEAVKRRVGTERVVVYYLVLEEDVRRKRIEGRKNPRDAYKLQDWESYAALGRDPPSGPPFPHYRVDTTYPTPIITEIHLPAHKL
eukprot:TRINITY_DN20371_c0_g1_i2.p1 TRINITY_DN20371_c0_g1~~TRINITY_DN20371_c0_g1_i2.p1  ORF type:complete len:141 (-),score=55.30 TRINITY_DN20371_c0_g1_i2:28-450(-)